MNGGRAGPHLRPTERLTLRVILTAATIFSGSGVSVRAADEPPRAARSVHLGYVDQHGVAFYNELTVQHSVVGSYFMAAGFNHGYFGIQHRAKDRVVIFSVWDPTRGDDANHVPVEERVEVLHSDPDVLVKRFGGEGTGGQSFFTYDWQPDATYRFLVRSQIAGEKTAYAGYFYLPEQKTWKHLVTFRTRTGGDDLRGLYSFVEDFRRDTRSAAETRRALFGNGWVQSAAGGWQPITRARFTASAATWEARETIDAGLARLPAGEPRFYLQTGGTTTTTTPLKTALECPASQAQPVDLPN